ncbi:hypothetical protein ACFWWT_36970 [Streptomyces sp. NPDC058676]|uniref:hypothetical protein n=1 Tax=unclassified Streptomyces TaxID=2593676 RepID=UPI003650CAA5
MTTHDDHTPAPPDDGEPTRVLDPADEHAAAVRLGSADAHAPAVPLGSADEYASTVRLGSADGRASTVRVGPVDEHASTVPFGSADGGASTVRLDPADGRASTVHLGPADEHASTVHLGPADGRASTGEHASSREHAPSDEPSSADAEYSATVLASHWIQRPEPDTTLVGPPATGILPTPTPTPTPTPAPTPPDRVEGTVLRFGPGVTAAVAHRTHMTLPAVPPPLVPPRRRLRRHALPALVLVSVIAFLAWQRHGPAVAVRTASVTARPTVLGCDATADIVALVATNGRPGTLSYRWTRSDGTASGVLREVVVRGQTQARLHLLWTFQGKGHYTARAELRVLTPTHRTVTAQLTYECP